jgi:gliding motility-associated lipoprotein GldH
MTKTGMRIRLPINTLLLLLFIAIVSVSCGKKPVYNEFRMIPAEGWQVKDYCDYEVELNDTTQLFNLYVNIRHAGNYPYQNLWLFVERMSPDSTVEKDTLECDLTDYSGKWLGEGSGSVYLLKVPFQQQKIELQGKYIFKIAHGMREEVLTGVHAIGLRIESQDGEE